MVNPVLVQLRHFLRTHCSHHRTRVYPKWESSHFIFTGWYSTQVYRYIFLIDSYRQLFINWYFVNILWEVVIQYYFCFYESQLCVMMLCFISLFKHLTTYKLNCQHSEFAIGLCWVYGRMKKKIYFTKKQNTILC